jgi:hypothetical protein
MMIVFIVPHPEIKQVVSTTSDFQRTEVDFSLVSDNNQQNFAFLNQELRKMG